MVGVIGIAAFTSILKSLPRKEDGFCAFSPGSPAPPPSPVVKYKNPSGPKFRSPPL
jgi:hypothetical protein